MGNPAIGRVGGSGGSFPTVTGTGYLQIIDGAVQTAAAMPSASDVGADPAGSASTVAGSAASALSSHAAAVSGTHGTTLTNARTPSAHAASHGAGQSDDVIAALKSTAAHVAAGTLDTEFITPYLLNQAALLLSSPVAKSPGTLNFTTDGAYLNVTLESGENTLTLEGGTLGRSYLIRLRQPTASTAATITWAATGGTVQAPIGTLSSTVASPAHYNYAVCTMGGTQNVPVWSVQYATEAILLAGE